MKIKYFLGILFFLVACITISFKSKETSSAYIVGYYEKLNGFKNETNQLLKIIENSNLSLETDVELILDKIKLTRNKLKGIDIWLRYLDPLAYKKINGPLPVEWETEVFEKWEKPYKREGAGLTLAQIYLEENPIDKQYLYSLINSTLVATQSYYADSVTENLNTHSHFFLSNRLYLLNLAAIYTSGFECPDAVNVIPELQLMLTEVNSIYKNFNESFSETPFSPEYISLYENTIDFVKSQPKNNHQFDHYTFIKDYINPLFILNQQFIRNFKVSTKSLVDYSLNKQTNSIFDKSLYFGQNVKGVYLRVNDDKTLNEISEVGRLLFYDPILSANNKRSCASCHKSSNYFTDTIGKTSLQFDGVNFLPRNTPSLINAEFNHLLMLDGKHISLQNQGKDVITNPIELGSSEKEVLLKILSCNDYKKTFSNLLKYTPQEKEITIEHITSAITFYFSKFSKHNSPFDNAMNNKANLDKMSHQGFNVFMSKAQCATCHFVPQFNGIKPPYVGSEFEVLGVPSDTSYSLLSKDNGRFGINPADETLNAFRTGSLRNIQFTKPYMHNGIFNNLMEVVEFYNGGGGAGRGLKVSNQTLSSDSLKLNIIEKNQLIAFMNSLSEDIPFEDLPLKLPLSKIKSLNTRKVGGDY